MVDKKMYLYTFIIFSLLSISSPAFGVIFGSLIMHNEQNNKTVIFLADVHEQNRTTDKNPIDQKLLKEAITQQSQIVNLAKSLKKSNVSTQIIIEDLPSFEMKIQPFKKNPLVNYGIWATHYSPLVFLEEKCKTNKIDCINAEFRNEQNEGYSHIKKNIEKDFPEVLSKLKSFYPGYNETAQNVKDYPFLDARFFQIINENSATITIVCAGSGHIATVSKS